MTPAQRIFEVMGDMLVKSLVLVVADIGAASGPQRLRLVDRLPFRLGRDALIRCVVVFSRLRWLRHHHRHRNMVRVFLDDRSNTPAVGKLPGIRLQMQNNGASGVLPLALADREFVLAS